MGIHERNACHGDERVLSASVVFLRTMGVLL